MSACGQGSSVHFTCASHVLKRVLDSLVCRKDEVHNTIRVCTLNAAVVLHSKSRFTSKLVTVERLTLLTVLWLPHLLRVERKKK